MSFRNGTMEQFSYPRVSYLLRYFAQSIILWANSLWNRALLPEKQQEKRQSIVDAAIKDIDQFCLEMEDCHFFQKILESLKSVRVFDCSHGLETEGPLHRVLWYWLCPWVEYFPISVCLRASTSFSVEYSETNWSVWSCDWYGDSFHKDWFVDRCRNLDSL